MTTRQRDPLERPLAVVAGIGVALVVTGSMPWWLWLLLCGPVAFVTTIAFLVACDVVRWVRSR